MIYKPGEFHVSYYGQVFYYPDSKAQRDLSSIWWWKHKRAYLHMEKELQNYWANVYKDL